MSGSPDTNTGELRNKQFEPAIDRISGLRLEKKLCCLRKVVSNIKSCVQNGKLIFGGDGTPLHYNVIFAMDWGYSEVLQGKVKLFFIQIPY